jgi:hypothetical protein
VRGVKTIHVEVLGSIPPCPRCQATEDNAHKAAARLADDAHVTISKRKIRDQETVAKFGVLLSPALAVNGVVRIMGKVPDVGVIERLLRSEL